MNRIQFKNNLYKNGEYHPCHSEKMVRENAQSIAPSVKQVQYRDAIYKFCLEKKLVGDGFRLGRTRQTISANIRAFITILNKHGFADEFFGGAEDG